MASSSGELWWQTRGSSWGASEDNRTHERSTWGVSWDGSWDASRDGAWQRQSSWEDSWTSPHLQESSWQESSPSELPHASPPPEQTVAAEAIAAEVIVLDRSTPAPPTSLGEGISVESVMLDGELLLGIRCNDKSHLLCKNSASLLWDILQCLSRDLAITHLHRKDVQLVGRTAEKICGVFFWHVQVTAGRCAGLCAIGVASNSEKLTRASRLAVAVSACLRGPVDLASKNQCTVFQALLGIAAGHMRSASSNADENDSDDSDVIYIGTIPAPEQRSKSSARTRHAGPNLMFGKALMAIGQEPVKRDAEELPASRLNVEGTPALRADPRDESQSSQSERDELQRLLSVSYRVSL